MYAKFGKTPTEWRETPAPARYFLEQAWRERCGRIADRNEELQDQYDNR